MDELSFGPRREPRRPSRRRRALVVAVSIASVGAAGVLFTQHAITSPPPAAAQSSALPSLSRPVPSADCPPVHATWPDLASLPAGLRLAAFPEIIGAEFSGECPPRHAGR